MREISLRSIFEFFAPFVVWMESGLENAELTLVSDGGSCHVRCSAGREIHSDAMSPMNLKIISRPYQGGLAGACEYRLNAIVRLVVVWIWLSLILLPARPEAQQHLEADRSTPTSVAMQAIENKGSDTLVNLALAWAEFYMHQRPEVRISVTGGGSGTGIAAMINGTVGIANASREMKKVEIDALKAKGVTPMEFVVARDAIAVVVNRSNPVSGLTLSQISALYTGGITNWRQVGGEDRPVVLLSRESNSGTYVYFLENVIRMGKKSDLLFSPDTLLMPSSEGISAEVRHNPNAIGYDGLGYVTPDQKVLGVAKDTDSPYVMPSIDSVNDGSYPISRPLYMYTAGEPRGLIKSYLEWVLNEGQRLVPKLGFVPLY
jgi:phosphate transport system substrate-binding protein